MERWSGKIAVVTGASAGIGAAIVKDLANAGLIVVGLARRAAKVEELKSDIKNGEIHARECDVSNEESIKSAFEWIEKKFGSVSILVNNAGIVHDCGLLDEDNSSMLTSIINVNVLGALFCAREAFKIMNKKDDYGYIININSVAGHKVMTSPPGMKPAVNIYAGSKHAMVASSEVIRQELNFLKKDKIRVSSLSPGLVKTDIFEASGNPIGETIFQMMPYLSPEDISQGVLYILSTPPHVQVYELTLKPVGESF